MITIVYGEDADKMEEVAKQFKGRIVLYPEHRLYPRKQAEFIIDLAISMEDVVIVTFSSVFANCIGLFIWKQCINRDDVKIIVCGDEGWLEAKFDQENACLDSNWPYGLLNWGGQRWEEEQLMRLKERRNNDR